MLSGGAISCDIAGVDMPVCSHIPNINATAFVRTSRADLRARTVYPSSMARRGIPRQPVAWYLPEWMEACGLKGRGAQARMMELTGWSRATMSQLYNGQQDLNSKYLDEAAAALNVEKHELLMRPEVAMALRRLRQSAAQIVENAPDADADDASGRSGTHG